MSKTLYGNQLGSETLRAGKVLTISVDAGGGAIVEQFNDGRKIAGSDITASTAFGPFVDDTVLKVSAKAGATVTIGDPVDQVAQRPTDSKAAAVDSLVSGGWTPPTTYTLATLPAAAANADKVAYVSDVGAGIYVRSNGTRWLPLNGRAVLYEVPAAEPTSSTAAETTVISVPLPIGLWANGDTLQVTARVSKSGSSDSHTFIARISSNAATLGTTTSWSAGQPATTTRFAMFMFNLKRVSATSVKPGASGAGFSATSTTAPTAVTVPNMDTQQTYLQLTSTITGGGGETVTWENARVEWVPAYA